MLEETDKDIPSIAKVRKQNSFEKKTLKSQFSYVPSVVYEKVLTIFCYDNFQGIGSALDEDSLLRVIEEFHIWQSHPVVLDIEMDDDCQRGMFRAYHVITSLMHYKASSFANKGTQGYS